MTRPPAYQNIDFSQYPTWPKVVSKIDGQTYYQVPGDSGKYFNPYAGSNGTVQDLPEKLIQNKKNVDDSLQPPKPGIGDTVAPVVGTVGGIVGSKLAVDYATGTGAFAPKVGAEVGKKVVADAATNTATNTGSSIANSGGGITGGSQGAAQTGSNISSSTTSGAAGGPVPVGTAENGGTMMSDGSTVMPDGTFVAGEGTPNFSVGSPSYAGYVAAAIEAARGLHRAFTDHKASSRDQAANLQTSGVMAVGDVYSGGLLSAADAVSGGRISKLVNKGVGLNNKINSKLTFGLSDKINDKIFHQSTRGLAEQHTGELLKQGKDDKQWQDYVSGMRAGYNAPPPDPSKPFAGKYASWDEYKTAGLDAGDLTGVYGNLNTYGPQWAKLTLDQQKAVTQANINDGLYDSKKGEVVLNNSEKANQNLKNVLAGNQTATPTATTSSTPSVPMVQTNGQPVDPTLSGPLPINGPARSQTLSPGIGLNGKPISYGSMRGVLARR